jgi:hypothetical protein
MKSDQLMRKVAQVAPTQYSFFLKTASEVKESPFRDEIVGELDSLIKKAMDLSMLRGPAKSMGTGLAQGAGAVAGAAGMGIAYSLAGDMYDSLKRGLTKSRDYKNMLMANPDLRKEPAAEVQKAFSVLHRFNPEFASDPTVAGAFVRKNVNYPDASWAAEMPMLSSLTQSRKNISDTHKLPNVPQVPDFGGRSLEHKKMKQDISMGAERHQMGKEEHERGGAKHQMDTERHHMGKEKHELDKERSLEGRDRFNMDVNRYNAEEAHRPVREEMDLLNLERLKKQRGGNEDR